jgi:hypothetical protein
VIVGNTYKQAENRNVTIPLGEVNASNFENYVQEKKMNLSECQREMRVAFLGGFAGQLASGLIWLISGVLSLILSPGYGMLALFLGSMFIFPITRVILRLLGRTARVDSENKLWGLGMQIAFTVPINYILVYAATLYRESLYFPAAMIVVGAHYLPFITLYGMKLFGVLSVILTGTGTLLAVVGSGNFSSGAWITAITLISFAFVGLKIALREQE